jgi:hypothetical protein
MHYFARTNSSLAVVQLARQCEQKPSEPKRHIMEPKAGQIVDWIEKLVEEKIRLESIKSKREELLRRNVSEDLIRSGLDEARRKIAEARLELTRLDHQLEQKGTSG